MLKNSPKQYFVLTSKDRANRLYKEIYTKCIYWLEKFLSMGSKRVIWKLLLTKNGADTKMPTTKIIERQIVSIGDDGLGRCLH